jgi:hypothetical protein
MGKGLQAMTPETPITPEIISAVAQLRTPKIPIGIRSRSSRTEPETITLVLRPLTSGWRTSPTQRLRLALKRLLRDYGLRCENIQVEEPKQ